MFFCAEFLYTSNNKMILNCECKKISGIGVLRLRERSI